MTKQKLSNLLSENERQLKEIFQDCSDITFHPIFMNRMEKALVVYIDGMIDVQSLETLILQSLVEVSLSGEEEPLKFLQERISDQAFANRHTRLTDSHDDVVKAVLHGDVALLADGEQLALLANLCGYEKRQIAEPGTESVVRGPREGFTESLRTNTSMLRRRMRSPKLKMESMQLGEMSQTEICIVYMEGIVKPETLAEVRRRVGRIKIDAILDSGYIEEFIEEAPNSPFPSVQNTERPDVVLSSVLEGRVAIIVDGTPFVLIVPMTLWSAIQAAEDYYESFIYTSSIRMLRFFLLAVSFLLPSLYVATTTFHPQLIPARLLLTIATAREGVPFPTVVEVLLMEIMFEALREAGIRLPKPVGSAVSMVGGLVIGESAVHAGIVSAPTVIIVAFTGIASFSLPRYNLGLAFRLLRFPLLLLAGALGIYGVGCGVIALLIHLVNLQSFGVPYLSPVAPKLSGNLKDIFIRAPHWAMNMRPVFMSGSNKLRTPKGQAPGKSQKDD